MTYPKGKFRFAPGHRLYEPFYQLYTLTACITIAGVGALPVGAQPTATLGVNFQSQKFRTEVIMPFEDFVPLAIANKSPPFIDLEIRSIRRPGHVDGIAPEFTKFFDLAASIVFVNFYEAHKDWFDLNLPTDVTRWPSILNFARVIRNSASHAGKLHFKGPNSPGASWRHLAYTAADHGRLVLGSEGADLRHPDLAILMIEMAQEMDKLGVPIPN